ncbi:PhzF family phenazine biosynthesis isomerase [Nocardioides sp. STR2]|uniref:PhzF family phenazine biosynthesis isomerase n=1 Tax=Nocardioides pini TaxID=2975053 RepID=A0ABT4CHW6_9ACTN|nr:PhzF family phenazine biosynthesis isomerase [Nocardioides pini]MCY4728570.1 PhzF family phenazine biosynthesis isomerase [Nocardioides pini]
MTVEVLRYSAFPEDGAGGNPAGVVLGAASLSEPQMRAIAEAIGYSETAFLSPTSESDPARLRVRYFSPRAEVDFCGHATVASAVAIAERYGAGVLTLETNVGLVPVSTRHDGVELTATLTSPATWTRPAGDSAGEALDALRLAASDLDPAYPVHVAFAGNKHLVVGVRDRWTLDALDYDYGALERLMGREGWTTVHVFWAEDRHRFHARNAFPPGGVREDPATGAAAAAFGGYLRQLELVDVPSRIVVLQGRQMGAPSRLVVDLRPGSDTVEVTGTARRLTLTPYDDVDLP